MRKIVSAILLLALFVTGLAIAPDAAGEDGAEVIFKEDFESYESGVDVNSTSMSSVFVCDYNSIGDGSISVSEASSGNLYLRSHVFTQIYIGTPIIGKYEFSLDVSEANGNIQAGVFVRAPKTIAAYYEGDGHPDTSTCLSGIYINPHKTSIGVNVKTYDAEADSTSNMQNNITMFDLPDGVRFPYTLKVKDDTEKIEIYCNDGLLCSVVMSEPGRIYEKHQATDPCFGKAVLYGKDGAEIATYKDPLLQSDGSVIGWSTRVSDISVDNIILKAEKTYAALLAINTVPAKVTKKNLKEAAEKVRAARELYDALTDGQKALITNLDRLTKAETEVKALTPETTEAKEVPTEALTETVTASLTDEPTAAPAEKAETEKDAKETEEEIDIKTVDDSLAIWILISVMIAAAFATAGFVVIKLRKSA